VIGPRGPSQLRKGTDPTVRLIHSLKSRRDSEEGFTLIELMVVVLIIAILIAIAIPTFLGARQRAQDRAAQSNIRNGLTAEKTFYTDNQVYSNDVPTMKGIEPSLAWEAAATPSASGKVAVDVQDSANIVCVQAQSKSGTYFALADIATGGGAGTYYNKGASAPACPTVSTSAPAGWTTNGW
jgi:type IV pilus assembly protein PilA